MPLFRPPGALSQPHGKHSSLLVKCNPLFKMEYLQRFHSEVASIATCPVGRSGFLLNFLPHCHMRYNTSVAIELVW